MSAAAIDDGPPVAGAGLGALVCCATPWPVASSSSAPATSSDWLFDLSLVILRRIPHREPASASNALGASRPREAGNSSLNPLRHKRFHTTLSPNRVHNQMRGESPGAGAPSV